MSTATVTSPRPGLGGTTGPLLPGAAESELLLQPAPSSKSGEVPAPALTRDTVRMLGVNWSLKSTAVEDLKKPEPSGPIEKLSRGSRTIVLSGLSNITRENERQNLKIALDNTGADGYLAHIREIRLYDSVGAMRPVAEERAANIRAIEAVDGVLAIARTQLATRGSAIKLFQDWNARAISLDPEQCVVADRTQMAISLREGDSGYQGPDSGDDLFGSYHGLPIIHRDGRITGGVYLSGSRERHAISVSDQDLQLLALGHELLTRVDTRGPDCNPLRAVCDIVVQRMPYWRESEHTGVSVDAVVAKMNEAEDGRKAKVVPLGDYLLIPNGHGMGGGSCAHQALLACYLVELLQTERNFNVKVSFERNSIGGRSAHGLARCTWPDSRVWALDPSENYADDILRSPHRGQCFRDSDRAVIRRMPL